MKTHKPSPAVVLALALLCYGLAPPLQAVGLGVATVQSGLNEPLRLRIEILELQGVALEDVHIELASAEEYRHFGVERDPFFDNIRFNKVAEGDAAYLELSTADDTPVPLSFMVLVLDVRWPAGRLLSEQNISLDTPVFDPDDSLVSRQVQPAVVPGPGSGSGAGDIPQTVEAAPGETISALAARVRPGASVTLQQTMLALREANPEAFEDGNINRLQAGRILRVPELARIQEVDPRQAAAFVDEQNRAFADFQVLTELAPQPPQQPAEETQPQGRLSVITEPGSEGEGGVSQVPELAELDRRIADLEARLALRQEEADRARLQRVELNARLTSLETQINEAEEIIRLRDLQLAQIRQALAEAGQTPQQPGRAGTVETLRGLLDAFIADLYYWLGGALAVVLLLALMLRSPGRSSLGYAADGMPAFDKFDIDPDHLPKAKGSPPGGRAPGKAPNKPHNRKARPRRAAGRDPHEIDPDEWVSPARPARTRGKAGGQPPTTESKAPSPQLNQTAAGEWVSAARPAIRKKSADTPPAAGPRAATAPRPAAGPQASAKPAPVSPQAKPAPVRPQAKPAPVNPPAMADPRPEPELAAGPEQQPGALFEPGELEQMEFGGGATAALSGDDETAIKLELAYAYQKMGDTAGAADILREVIKEGNRYQVKEARQMLDSLS